MSQNNLKELVLKQCESLDWLEVVGSNYDYIRDGSHPLGEHLVRLNSPAQEVFLENYGEIHFIALMLAKGKGCKYYKYILKNGGGLEFNCFKFIP